MTASSGHFCCCDQPQALHPDYCRVRENIGGILSSGEPLSFHNDQVIFYQGHYPCGFFVICSGTVDFERDGEWVHRMEAGTSEWDGLIGLCQLISGNTYSLTCRARSEVRLLFYPKAWLSKELHHQSEREHEKTE